MTNGGEIEVAPAAMTSLFAAILRGDRVEPAALAALAPETIGRRAVHHGVLTLVADRLSGQADIPGPLQSILKEHANQELATDLLREAELKRLIAELEIAGVRALLIKGAQLAYSHYPRPDLRPRVDTDILIPANSRRAVHDILVGLGYCPKGQMSGELVVYQAFYVKRRNGVVSHAVDVHWKIANPQLFAGVLSYEELTETAVPLPQLHSAARGLSNVHALLIACVHRVAHHYDSDHLIWLYDIDVIAGQLSPAEWEQFADLAIRRGVAAVCRRSLARTVQWFRTEIPACVRDDSRFSDMFQDEPTAAYLKPRPHIRVILDDLRALPAWTDRWRLIREHTFPPSDYMRNVYAPSNGQPLPLLYVRRVLKGARKWLAQAPFVP
jgi:hypothetical protein